MCCQIPKIEYKLQQNGLDYNAYTTDLEVCFYLSGLNNNVNKQSELYINTILNSNITKEVFLREKNIVIQEYMQCFSKQSFSHIHNILRTKLNSCSTIGYKQDLQSLSYDKFMDYKQTFFNNPTYKWFISHNKPKNINLTITDEKIKLTTDYILNDYNTFEIENIINVKSNSHIVFYNLIDLTNSKLYFCLNFLTMILQNGLSSPLINELRLKRGLIYNITCGVRKLSDNQGLLLIYTSTDKNSDNLVVKCIEKIINNLHRYINQKKYNYNKKCFQLAIKQANILNYNNSMFFNSHTIDYHNYIDSLTFDEFMDICVNYFNTNTLLVDIDRGE